MKIFFELMKIRVRGYNDKVVLPRVPVSFLVPRACPRIGATFMGDLANPVPTNIFELPVNSCSILPRHTDNDRSTN